MVTELGSGGVGESVGSKLGREVCCWFLGGFFSSYSPFSDGSFKGRLARHGLRLCWFMGWDQVGRNSPWFACVRLACGIWLMLLVVVSVTHVGLKKDSCRAVVCVLFFYCLPI